MEAWKKEMYLAHHGILGQKWGKQNGPPYPLNPEDHSAAEKKAAKSSNKPKDSYKYKRNEKRMQKDYSQDESLIRKIAKTNFGRHKLANFAEKKYEETERKIKKDGGDARLITRQKNAQKKANKDYEEYVKHTSTGKLIVQDLLMGKFGSGQYRAARARGAGRIRSLFESGAVHLDPLGVGLAAVGNYRKNGSPLVLGDNEGEVL